MTTLVVYASKYGTTQGIAERTADEVVSSGQFRGTAAMDQTIQVAGRADRAGPSSRTATSTHQT
jgi:menaquinone-dependent protoporphyrinogen IX oxidase